MMHALDPAVHGPIFNTIKELLPPRPVHPLGCHRRRISDGICFRGILLRLVTGMSWETIEFCLGGVVSDTTLRHRRNEWIAAGVFDDLARQAVFGYERLVGLDLRDVCIDASDHLAPGGGNGTGHSFKHPGRLAWKWWLAVDANGIPISWLSAAGNRNDYAMFFPLLDQLNTAGLCAHIDTLHADRGFNYASTPERVTSYGINHFVAPPRQTPKAGRIELVGMGKRWIVEAANSWLRNNGQLRRNTDRHPAHREAALNLAITILITHRLINPRTSPIR